MREELRDELREELPRIFTATDSVFFNAAPEPSQVLLFGGVTATLHEWRVAQFGPIVEVYNRPENLISAALFNGGTSLTPYRR